MDEARAVLWRLGRIEALEREHAPARTLLAEVRALLAEAEAWTRTDRAEAETEAALAECRRARGLG